MARRPIEQRTVTYGSIGGTQAVDLLTYPPRGYRPLELRGRVGHGDARWDHAVEQLLTGGVYRGAGLAVRVIPSAGEQDAAHYLPVSYDETGQPVSAATLEIPDDEFSPSGERYVRPGDTVIVGPAIGGRMMYPLPGRVVLRDEAENRVLYAVGTLPGHPLSGEESFLLEREADGGIWLTVRSFARAAHVGWALANPALGIARRSIAKRFVRALAGPIDGSTVLPSQRLAEVEPVASEPTPESASESAPVADAAAVEPAESTPAIEPREPDRGPQDS